MRTIRSKFQKMPQAPPDPAAIAKAKEFLEETDWDKYWADLSERMQRDVTYDDFSFFTPDGGK